ncbi:hypothetical protein ACEN2S_16425 [Phaeovulum sp. W22_SRMD_FR3]
MNRPKPAEVKQAGDAFGVTTIRVDRHGDQGTFELPRLHPHDIRTRD